MHFGFCQLPLLCVRPDTARQGGAAIAVTVCFAAELASTSAFQRVWEGRNGADKQHGGSRTLMLFWFQPGLFVQS